MHSPACNPTSAHIGGLGPHGEIGPGKALLVLRGRLAEFAQAAELSVRSILATNPAMTGQELLRRLEDRARQTASDFAQSSADLGDDEDPCGRCA